jgi:hypothetical protein
VFLARLEFSYKSKARWSMGSVDFFKKTGNLLILNG